MHDEYYYIKPKVPGDRKCLAFKHNDLSNKYVISRQIQLNNGKKSRVFSAYQSVDDFAQYYCKLSSKDRHHYEIIHGDSPQKIYFDIDINPDLNITLEESETLIRNLKQAILDECKVMFPDKKELPEKDDIVVFTTRGSTKISYHVVLNRFYVASNTHNRVICGKIRDRIDERYHKCIDMLYSSLQQFRLLGSQKLGSNNDRIKVIHKELTTWRPKGNVHTRELEKLQMSSITYTTSCRELDVPVPEKRVKSTVNVMFDDKEYAKLEDLVETHLGCFRIVEGDSKSLFHLRRTERDVQCAICEVAHENENGFLVVNGEGEVFFNCFRNLKSDSPTKLRIGKIEVADNPFVQEFTKGLLDTSNEKSQRSKDIQELPARVFYKNTMCNTISKETKAKSGPVYNLGNAKSREFYRNTSIF